LTSLADALRDLTPRWQRYWPEADAALIAADAEARMHDAVEAWGLAAPEPLGGGVGALTCAAGDVVVKVLPRGHPEDALMRGEAGALSHWREISAAVDLLDTRDEGMTLLLRRLRPATSLDELAYEQQLVIAGRLVASLHAAGDPPEALPPIDAYVEPYRRAADAELDQLLATSDAPVAVHADLHGGNVLRDGDGWVAIDPKGVRGDRHLDIWLLLCPQAPPLPDADPGAEMRRRLAIYCDAAGLDAARAAAWTRVVARAEAVISADSAVAEWPQRLRRIADALAQR
jgi:streptomycin 6-kinase